MALHKWISLPDLKFSHLQMGVIIGKLMRLLLRKCLWSTVPYVTLRTTEQRVTVGCIRKWKHRRKTSIISEDALDKVQDRLILLMCLVRVKHCNFTVSDEIECSFLTFKTFNRFIMMPLTLKKFFFSYLRAYLENLKNPGFRVFCLFLFLIQLGTS